MLERNGLKKKNVWIKISSKKECSEHRAIKVTYGWSVSFTLSTITWHIDNLIWFQVFSSKPKPLIPLFTKINLKGKQKLTYMLN